MNFNSLEFLIYLPIVIIFYFILPHKVRWAWLLLASYYFYMSWNPWLILLIVATTLITYLSALIIEKCEGKKAKKFWLIVAIVGCLSALIFFKYFNFLIQTAIDFLNLFSLKIDDVVLDIILPVGISFYTFQTLSYVIDVYRGDFAAEKHLGYYALFVSYFPQLVAGPIERPGDLIPQLRARHKVNAEDMNAGFRLLLSGFFRKCVVADFLGVFVNNVFNNLAAANGLAVFIAGALFCIEIYCDFAGYSEIAMGAARMMGVHLTQNFKQPYLATSYSDFFRRWHITLNRWFTDYLYIPLGGSRKGKPRRIINTIIVFFLSGLWHGAGWTFVFWGLHAAFFVSIESLLRKPFHAFCDKHKINLDSSAIKLVRRAAVFALLVTAGVIFRSPDLASLSVAYNRMFTAAGFSAAYFAESFAVLGITAADFIQIALSIVCMTLIYNFAFAKSDSNLTPLTPPTREEKTKANALYAQKVSVCFYAIVAIALVWIALLATHGVSDFAYFQF